MFPQLQDIGYENHNSIQNLGSLGILVIFLILKLVFVFAILRPFSLLTGRLQKHYQDFRRQLFWSDFITLLLDACFEILISSYLQVKYDPWIGTKETFFSGDLLA